MLAVLAATLTTGCGSEPSVRGVAAVGSQRDAGDDRIVVTLPGDFVLGPAEAALDDGDGTATTEPVLAPVETLVEPPTPIPDSVLVIGDSLTVAAEDEIDAALTALGLEVLGIDGMESRRMANGGSQLPPGVDAIAAAVEAGADPGLWVVALGTNDVGAGDQVDGFRSSVRAVLDEIPSDAAVVWVDVWIGGRQEASAEVNAALRDELRSWAGGAAVVDWYGRGAAGDGAIAGDGVHLTEAGQAAYAGSIAEAIDSLFG